MNPRASLLLTLPALALLAAGCATSNPGAARSTEPDDVYFTSSDRLAPRYQAPAMAAADPTAPPAADGSVANPDYTGQAPAGNQDYYNNSGAYTATPRVTSPYYGSFNQYNSGYAYDPFWSGTSLAIGCGYGGYGWGYSPFMMYAPIYAGPRVRFGVSFGYGWGYSSWAAPMYGWAGPTFYNPYYDPFWGPSYYGYGYGWGYPMYGYGYYGGGWGNGYYQGFYDGVYAGSGGIRSGRRVTYGPRLDRSGERSTAYSGGRGVRTTRDDGGNRYASPGSGNLSAGSYSGYGGGYSGATRRTDGGTRANGAYPATPSAPMTQPNAVNSGRATRMSGADYQYQAPQSQQQAPPQYQAAQPQMPPARREGFFQRAVRSMESSESSSRPENRSYSSPSPARSSGGGFGGGGGGNSGSSGGGARRGR